MQLEYEKSSQQLDAANNKVTELGNMLSDNRNILDNANNQIESNVGKRSHDGDILARCKRIRKCKSYK